MTGRGAVPVWFIAQAEVEQDQPSIHCERDVEKRESNIIPSQLGFTRFVN